MTIAAIDIGYRNTKIAFSHRGLPKTLLFPSLAPRAQHQALAGATLPHRNTRLVEVDEQTYEIGEDAHLLLGPRSNQVLHEDFVQTPEYHALLLGALSHIGASQIDVLVGGLPVRHIDGHKTALEALMRGAHRLPGLGEIHVRRAVVIPQPLGGLIHHQSQTTAPDTEETVLLVDPGYFTLDWTCAQGLKYLPAMTGSFPAGISSGLRAAADRISGQLGAPFDDLDTLDRKLRQKTVRIAGHNFARDELDGIIADALRPGLVEMKNRLGKAQSIDRIVVCGGGAPYYRPLLEDTWPHLPIEVADDPVMANVRGFYRLALDLSARQQPAGAAA